MHLPRTLDAKGFVAAALVGMLGACSILLMIGTNDVGFKAELATAPDRLAKLLDTILSTAPSALLVVGQIIASQTDDQNAEIRTYNAAIPSLIQARASAGNHIVMVDMYGAFVADANYKSDYMSDNLHPNDKGYAILANTWYASIARSLSRRRQ